VCNCARSSSTLPGSAEVPPGDAGMGLLFFEAFSTAEGALRPPLFVPHHPMAMGGLKWHEPRRWWLPTCTFWHFLCPHRLETSQGVSVDSLEVDAIEIGCIVAPDRRQHRQNAPKRCLTMWAWFCCFFANYQQQRGRGGPLCSIHATPRRWGVLKSKNNAGGGRPPACSGTPCASGLMALVGWRRGVVYECVADVVAAGKRLDVPATSLRH
jgi:hypothetical protein